jgi:GDP-L-fucose synthase
MQELSVAEKKTALVVGGAGFIGSNLVRRLVADGYTVRATIHTRDPLEPVEGVEYVRAELTSLDDCVRVVAGMDYVFMAAASTAGAAVMASTPLVQVTPNVVMNSQILEASYAAGVKKFLFISSSAAYPPSGDRPVSEDEMFQGDPPDVYHAVGWMKRYSEILCHTYARKIKKPMATVVVRPSNVYGPFDKFDFARSHVTGATIRKVADRHSPIQVWGTGDDVRDLIYVDDFIDGTMKAFNADKDFIAVNIAAGQGYTVKEVLQTLLEVDGYTDADVQFDASKPQMIPIRLIDATLAEKELGFRATTSLRDGLKKTIEWYRAHPPRE